MPVIRDESDYRIDFKPDLSKTVFDEYFRLISKHY